MDNGFHSYLTPPIKGESKVWLNFIQYSKRILGETNEDIWRNPARFIDLYNQAQQLLKSDVLSIPVLDFYSVYLKNCPEVKNQWQGKKTTFALKKLLKIDEPLNILMEALEGIVNLYGDRIPIFLVIPSPHYWLYWLKDMETTKADIIVSENELESATMYLADFLRSFSKVGITGIVIEEYVPFSNETYKLNELYQSIFNVGKHYQWAIGLLLKENETCISLEKEIVSFKEKIDFFLFDGNSQLATRVNSAAEIVSGWGLNKEFWTGDSVFPPTVNSLAYGTIPEDANPERVLQLLQEIRMK